MRYVSRYVLTGNNISSYLRVNTMVVAPTVKTSTTGLYFQGFLGNVNGIKGSLLTANYKLD